MYALDTMNIVEYNYKPHYQRFAPGAVGPVGAVLMSTQMKRSFPDATLRWTPEVSGPNEKYFGSNVQDGLFASFTTGGGGARAVEIPKKKTMVVGNRYQNIIPGENFVMPVQGEIHNLQQATRTVGNYNAQRTGNRFGGVMGYQIRDGGIPVGVMPRATQLDNSDPVSNSAPAMTSTQNQPNPNYNKGFF